MRAATLFSGIGAPEAAMPGWQWLWHAEVEAFPSAVMAARHPGSINLGDVTAPDFVERALDVGRPDCLVFGSPCQSFSVAGKRLGMDDPRGNLALVALALVRRLRPSVFVFARARGGSDDISNLQWVCREINLAKRDMTEADLLSLCQDASRWILTRLEREHARLLPARAA